MKYADLNTELTTLRTIKAEHDIRMGDVPKDGAYKIELKGVEVPEGMDLKINEDHPMAAPVKGWAAKHGVPQSAVTELVAIQAQAEIAKATEFKTALAGERTKLGDKGADRIAAVKTALTGRVGDKAAALIAGMVSAEQVEAYESLLRISIASPPAPGGDNANKVDYASMSPLERLHFAHETSRKVA